MSEEAALSEEPKSSEKSPSEPSIGMRLASSLYALGARAHRAVMRRSSPGRGRPACAVVSVGALTVGGAGKTPTAARLASQLAARGFRVVLASRGYRGQSRRRVTVVSDGVRIHSSVEWAGDESLVLAAHAQGVPVLVGADRRIVGHHAVSVFDCEILVLDDGFQHHRIDRDFDLVCIDAVAGVGNGWTLPGGPLREPLATLRHADAVCMIRDPLQEDEGNSGIPDLPAKLEPGLERWSASRRAIDLVPLGGGVPRPLTFLNGRPVGLIAGLARPKSLRRSVEALGAQVRQERFFPDHHAYCAADVDGLMESVADVAVDFFVTTEKDALKILPDWVPPASVWVLRLEMKFDQEEDRIDTLLAKLESSGRLRLGAPVDAEAS